ncbi:MAG: UDP-N-acetylenolpyruvoylglucosamine reductase [Zetaproteobacteria bacterium CG12_big_fil_rev_8_21_14_0_65_55_1124]|nr:MAG: UDP-N-acetylenolpyruvoylglucosamine reductase [Zetaproteobacteria bacterium CG1_02_55_237]PIS19912.1 MAG: UDP-N-acetylenolpyruvoylglucosamine reductase [Zetaproteobacteria bacterium CG08_land_8_20_14_0_20_55_17]PIW43665.1 MAG: UDP-N-acetylenolpyruvoylglucosamine reductase [Zetaproteobacteria bacterium CG12_big_fil_rev_8_21_14_0_65_55_1124]PIY52666.1 MAG: UDP-N-acetylenolpyruvoylglucosamine reductase [Zetaproteobacteria bacterium CG_4_10_14_0_8_um_filter_55_43]PIZ37850.1 MAG: UDP-N-acety
MSDWLKILQTCGTCTENEPLSGHTTLGVGGPARWFFRPDNQDALCAAMLCIPADIPLLPLGRGSNLLPPDSGFPGVVLDLSSLNHIQVNGTILSAECGVRMSRVSRICADHGLTGLEFMATVPGDIGGGVAMNAGAFGQQIADCLTRIHVVRRDGEKQELQAAELEMAYRHTSLPYGSLVVSAEFHLQEDDGETVRERIRQMRTTRGRTQPLELPNCGSVFKNPDGDHAARLIEAAGLKGHRIGGASISAKHANFIVNEDSASSSDVLALIQLAQKTVEKKFGVRLEPEVRMLGEPA